MLEVTSKTDEGITLDFEVDDLSITLRSYLEEHGFHIDDIVEVAADRLDLEVILERFINLPGIPVNKLRHPVRMSWFGDHAKFIIANWT